MLAKLSTRRYRAGLDGTMVPLGLAEGATENATVVCDLLAGSPPGWVRRPSSSAGSTAICIRMPCAPRSMPRSLSHQLT